MNTLCLSVQREALPGFTTILQSGIELNCPEGASIGIFLNNLPGFDVDYLSDRVQTIFIDGNAIDDMEKIFTGPTHVLALSAAMPGLAGAIFRRNSLCASLRTRPEKMAQHQKSSADIKIRLKLFNVIALEKGPGLLEHGGFFQGQTIIDFFRERPRLLDAVVSSRIAGENTNGMDMFEIIRPQTPYHVTINSNEK